MESPKGNIIYYCTFIQENQLAWIISCPKTLSADLTYPLLRRDFFSLPDCQFFSDQLTAF